MNHFQRILLLAIGLLAFSRQIVHAQIGQSHLLVDDFGKSKLETPLDQTDACVRKLMYEELKKSPSASRAAIADLLKSDWKSWKKKDRKRLVFFRNRSQAKNFRLLNLSDGEFSKFLEGSLPDPFVPGKSIQLDRKEPETLWTKETLSSLIIGWSQKNTSIQQGLKGLSAEIQQNDNAKFSPKYIHARFAYLSAELSILERIIEEVEKDPDSSVQVARLKEEVLKTSNFAATLEPEVEKAAYSPPAYDAVFFQPSPKEERSMDEPYHVMADRWSYVVSRATNGEETLVEANVVLRESIVTKLLASALKSHQRVLYCELDQRASNLHYYMVQAIVGGSPIFEEKYFGSFEIPGGQVLGLVKWDGRYIGFGLEETWNPFRSIDLNGRTVEKKWESVSDIVSNAKAGLHVSSNLAVAKVQNFEVVKVPSNEPASYKHKTFEAEDCRYCVFRYEKEPLDAVDPIVNRILQAAVSMFGTKYVSIDLSLNLSDF